jgi:hypothetical protein
MRLKEHVDNRAVRKAIESAESTRATSYLQHVPSLLDLMKANMTTAYRSAITTKPEYSNAEGQQDLLQCWYWIKHSAILVSTDPVRFANHLKQELATAQEYKLAPGGDFNYHSSKWLSLLMILQFVEKGDLATTESAVVISFVDSLPDEARFSVTTSELRDDLRYTSDAVVSCRNSLARTINRYDTTITKTMPIPTTPTKMGGGASGGQSGGGTSSGQGGAGSKAGGAAPGGAPPAIVLDKEMKKAIVLAVKSEIRKDNISDIDCRKYQHTGACKFGELCKFRHGPGDTRFDGNALKPEHAIKVNEAIQGNRRKNGGDKVYMTQAQISQM